MGIQTWSNCYYCWHVLSFMLKHKEKRWAEVRYRKTIKAARPNIISDAWTIRTGPLTLLLWNLLVYLSCAIYNKVLVRQNTFKCHLSHLSNAWVKSHEATFSINWNDCFPPTTKHKQLIRKYCIILQIRNWPKQEIRLPVRMQAEMKWALCNKLHSSSNICWLLSSEILLQWLCTALHWRWEGQTCQWGEDDAILENLLGQASQRWHMVWYWFQFLGLKDENCKTHMRWTSPHPVKSGTQPLPSAFLREAPAIVSHTVVETVSNSAK